MLSNFYVCENYLTLSLHTYTHQELFKLEAGGILPELHIAYHTYGELKPGRPVIWICHALTANSAVAEWWSGLVGIGKFFNPREHVIICANIIGSCYGSSGPLTTNPATGQPYYHDFPQVTIRDMVQAHVCLRRHLGIEKIDWLVGGSMGGYQVLEWALLEPERIGRLFLLSTGASESAWGIAVHTAQRLAIEADDSWQARRPDAGHKGLKAARAIGMLTYRNYTTFVRTQTDPDVNKIDHFKASSYILYQGDKLVKRFNAQSYWLLTKAMDSHNIARGRQKDAASLLQSIHHPAFIVGISSDILCPTEEQQFLAAHLPHALLHIIDSAYGHDGFLIEFEKIGQLLRNWK